MDDDIEPLEASEATVAEVSATLTASAYTFSRVLRAGLRDAVVEGENLSRILSRAALSISTAALTAGLRPLSNLVGQGASTLFAGLGKTVAGGVGAAATKMVPFAEGGVIGAPAAFALPSGRVGLMGEAGREAVLPLARGSDGRLGVALEGSAGTGTTINVHISTPDAGSFRRSEAQVTAMLARAVARGSRGL